MAKLEQNVHIRITTSMMESLNKLHQATGWSIAWIIRHATQKYLSEKGFLKK